MDAYPAVPIAAIALTVAAFAYLAIPLLRFGREAAADRRRRAERLAAAKQDPDSNEHQFRQEALIGDTNAWLSRRDATWQPLNPYTPDLALLIHRDGQPDVTAHPGDTLQWDGERISVRGRQPG